MSEWTDEAMDAWATYLDDVRRALADVGTADADVVIRDLEDHATHAFADTREPVTLARMQALIERLGVPAAIAAAASDTSDAGDAIRPDAESRRTAATLAYGSLAALALGLLVPATLAGAFPLAFLLARAGNRFAGNERSTQRALLYPALVAGSLALAAVLALWPFVLVLPLAATGGALQPWLKERGLSAVFGTTSYWAVAWGSAALAAGAWCAFLRRVVRERPAFLSFLFHPFAGAPEQLARIRRALGVMAASLLSLAVILFILAIW